MKLMNNGLSGCLVNTMLYDPYWGVGEVAYDDNVWYISLILRVRLIAEWVDFNCAVQLVRLAL